MKNTLRSLNVAIGNFFFKFRNMLFPVIYLIIFFFAKPQILFQDQNVTVIVMMVGMGVALLGQFVRLATIGFDYIERGGKDGKVYASMLVKGGVYAHTRNPMYIGNVLIACGLTIYSATPIVMIVAIPLFLFIYQAIIAAEENYLLIRFGDQFRDYCAQVNRIIPSFEGFSSSFAGVSYDWKKSLRKEYGTMFFVIASLLIVHAWRDIHLYGAQSFSDHHQFTFTIVSIFTISSYLMVRIMKKRGLLSTPS